MHHIKLTHRTSAKYASTTASQNCNCKRGGQRCDADILPPTQYKGFSMLIHKRLRVCADLSRMVVATVLRCMLLFGCALIELYLNAAPVFWFLQPTKHTRASNTHGARYTNAIQFNLLDIKGNNQLQSDCGQNATHSSTSSRCDRQLTFSVPTAVLPSNLRFTCVHIVI